MNFIQAKNNTMVITNGLNEVRKLSNYIFSDVISKITCPTLFIHSKKDYTSTLNNYKKLKAKLTTENINYLVVDHAPHNMFDSNIDKEVIQKNIINFIEKND